MGGRGVEERVGVQVVWGQKGGQVGQEALEDQVVQEAMGVQEVQEAMAVQVVQV